MKYIAKSLIVALIAFGLFQCTSKKETKEDAETNSEIKLIVGTYTGNGSDGIYSVVFNTLTGELTNKELVATTTNPSYLTISKDKSRVYAVNENDEGGVSAFKWNSKKTKLELISQLASEGAAPCYAELNGSEDLFAIANYTSGNMSVYKLSKDGLIQPSPTIMQHKGSGPVVPNQEGPHAHCARFSKGGRFLYGVDLGIDKVLVYPVTNGKIGEDKVALSLDPGDGPRHLIFDPVKEIAYIINELSSTVVSAHIDKETGILKRISKISALPDGFDGESYCADIHISRDGQFLYASNRGLNTIAIFRVSPEGILERVANVPVQGNWPRNFTLSPNEKFLLVANKKSNNITVFERDPESGLLSYTGKSIKMDHPVCLKF